MQRSQGRIFTTHTGSLPRTPDLTHMMVLLSRHAQLDRAAFDLEVEASTRRVIGAQLDASIDVGNDGEQSRESFFTYVQHRLSGYGGESARPGMRDIVRYPTFRELKAPDF